jgi:hypothetical protein
MSGQLLDRHTPEESVMRYRSTKMLASMIAATVALAAKARGPLSTLRRGSDAGVMKE